MTGSTAAPSPVEPDDDTRAAVADVVQRMVAARLGRAFLPLAPIFLFGAVQMVRIGPLESDYAVLALGSLAAAGAMLLYGNGAVHRALGPSRRTEARLAIVAGIVPYVFALYVLAFRSFEPVAEALGGGLEGGIGPVVLAVLFGLVSGRLLWHLSRLTELHRLARTMVVPAPGERP